MLFNSIDFLIFFPLVAAIFFVIPKKLRYIWLLIASYYFYMSWNPKYAILIALSTFITYISSIFIQKYNDQNRIVFKKVCLAGSIVSNLSILCLFKYANFIIINISKLLSILNIGIIERRLDLLLPVGISFYTFQALSYTIDVYRGEIKAETNIFKYALFVSFFPQLVAGPIERSKNLLCQINNIDHISVWNFEQVKRGFLLIMWGLFQKLVIADRAALLVNTVFQHYQNYGFLEILTAAILFAFQIYCDFGGYTNIARGSACVMGFHLMNNFRQPYLAQNIKDFWRRWHISLTSWFTDYLYIPLGGNRNGQHRKYLNILIVFGVSGLWHGASWNFIVWGLLHAIYQIIGDIKQYLIFTPPHSKFTIFESKLFKCSIVRMTGTFLLVDFAWIFFASSSLRSAVSILAQMFRKFSTVGIYSIGLSKGNWIVLIVSILLLMTVDLLHERKIPVFKVFNQQVCILRWILCVSLIWSIILFGIYGKAYDASQFIYFQF